jgi:hypothetical protein
VSWRQRIDGRSSVIRRITDRSPRCLAPTGSISRRQARKCRFTKRMTWKRSATMWALGKCLSTSTVRLRGRMPGKRSQKRLAAVATADLATPAPARSARPLDTGRPFGAPGSFCGYSAPLLLSERVREVRSGNYRGIGCGTRVLLLRQGGIASHRATSVGGPRAPLGYNRNSPGG